MLLAYKIIVSTLLSVAQNGIPKEEAPFKALGQMTGADSQVESPRVEMVQDNANWARVWRDHRQSTNVVPGISAPVTDLPDRPVVDFEKNVVLCLFGGQSRNVTGFDIVDVGDEKGTAFVRIRPQILPQAGASVLQNAYILIVLPRTKRKMTVELDQSSLGGRGWRTLASFGPTVKEKTKF
ncbi:hypothetical protein [Fimbriimonas ginsengisoli]|uniref:Uncharacterized protein n=1 Tax=Fimbriimonas ginsengisoli Gsoil 348 TaxID=661478 RepID=A0A068NLK2_FIMGI|nr:hypothetical protein [Fimbriimonas ginsengisoli]AIE84443.1 hypothetical protein OP10G_1075 [Fimbriimonas ginsengisoli Gsoil 348]